MPYEVAGQANVPLTIEYNGIESAVMTVAVVDSAPGLFTSTMSGAGQAAVLNQDNTYNGTSIPAARGSVIQVFATGEGQTDPAGVTGSIIGSEVSRPVLQVTATIGGMPARVVYAGSSPTSIAGLFQVNVVVPDDAPTGDVPIVITVGDASSQSGATVAIQ